MWSIRVALPVKSLGYVLVYVFETRHGIYVVDTGWDTDESWQSLCQGLQAIGHSVEEVRGVLITHVHPDHYGLAGRIRTASDAWIALHPADAALVHSGYLLPSDQQPKLQRALLEAGVPEADRLQVQGEELPESGYITHVEPDISLEDGERVPVPGWDIRSVWTPGHTPGHVCFAIPDSKIMLTGDHVLPRITPGISVFGSAGDDPLGDFLRSLAKVGEYSSELVLPAHEYSFPDLMRRVQQLQEHHALRFADIMAVVAAGADTAWTIASHVRWSTPWASLDTLSRRGALGETLAHLINLENRGLLVRSGAAPHRWGVAA
jgi:glyoxylase-like metal-dependent hydrolase (beta-lactamase superfamily II)